MADLRLFFSDAASEMIEGYPAVHRTINQMLEMNLVPAARLFATVVAMAEHRGDEINALRKELGRPPIAHQRLGRTKRQADAAQPPGRSG